MTKKKKNISQQRGGRDNPIATLVVIVLIIVIGGVTLIGMGGSLGLGGSGGTAGGGSVTGGQDIASLESQVKNLTEQAAKDPQNGTLQESLGIALFNLGNAYMQANDPKTQETFNKTIEVFNAAIKIKPDSKESLGDLATAYFYTNQTELAISTVEKALKIDPGFKPAIMNYGIYLANGRGDTAGAIKQWEKIPAGTPEYSQAQSLIQQYKQSN